MDLTSLPGPPGLPLVGNLLDLRVDRLHLILEAWSRRYGDVYRVQLGPRTIGIVSDLELVQRALRDRPAGFRRWRPIQEVIEEIGAGGVFSAEGEDWRKQRKLVMTAFQSGHLRASHGRIAAITLRLRDRWREAARRGDAVDALGDLGRFTVDVTTTVAFGRDTRQVDRADDPLQQRIGAVFAGISRRMLSPVPYWRYVRTPAERALEQAFAEVRAEMLALIRETQAELARDPARAASPSNLLEAMLLARDADDPRARLSEHEVLGNVITLLFAGEDTTSDTMAWMLYYMALRPDVQARMQAEVDAELGAVEVPASPEAAQRLRYVGAVGQEALRLRSAAPVIFLEACADTALGPLSLRQGDRLVLLTRRVALKQGSFSAPEAFSPERWLGEGPAREGTHEPRAALAFGSGPRVCPGRTLALVEAAMVGAMVARWFEVSLVDPRARVEEELGFTMKPKGLRVRFRERHGRS